MAYGSEKAETGYQLAHQYEQQRLSIHKPCEISRLEKEIEINHSLFQQRYDLAIVSGTLESVNTQTGQHILGRLRDLCVPRLAVLVDLNQCDWSTADLLAFGLVRINHYDTGEAQPVAYE